MEPARPPLIGHNIQKIRKAQNLTLGVLAEKSGVSKAMLSQIESDKVNPTVATLWKIARGLEVDLNMLLKGSGAIVRKFSVIRKNETVTLDSPQNGPHIEVLSPMAMAEDLEVYLLTFPPGGILRSSPHVVKTEECLTVMAGRVRVAAGETATELDRGDFIVYNCDIEHAIENVSDEPAIIHMIVRFMKKSWGVSES